MTTMLRYLVAVDHRPDDRFGLRIFDARRQRCVVEADGVPVTLLIHSACWPLELRGEGLALCAGEQVKRIICGLAQVRHLLRSTRPATDHAFEPVTPGRPPESA